MIYDVFLSYSSKDYARVAKVQRFLERSRIIDGEEVSLRVFRDETDLRGGELTDEILKAIDEAAYLVVCCSENSTYSTWMNLEVHHFLKTKELFRVIVLVLTGSTPEVLPKQLRASQLKELDLRSGWLLGWPRQSTRDELLRAVAKISDARLRSLIDWERRRQVKLLRQLALFLVVLVVLAASAVAWIVHGSPPLVWSGTDLDALERPFKAVQVIERPKQMAVVRAYSSWMNKSFNANMYTDDGRFEAYVADVEANGNLVGDYGYAWFVGEGGDGRATRDYIESDATGTLGIDVRRLRAESDRTILLADLVRLHPILKVTRFGGAERADSNRSPLENAARKFYEHDQRTSVDEQAGTPAELTSLTVFNDIAFAAFAGKPVFDDLGNINSAIKNFAAASTDGGKAWERLSLPQQIDSRYYALDSVVRSSGPEFAIVSIFRPVDGGNSQTRVPRVFLRRSHETIWLEVSCAGFDSKSFEVAAVTNGGDIIATNAGRLIIWQQPTTWERFLHGLGIMSGSRKTL